MIEPHVEDLVVETLGDVRKGRAEHSEGKDIIFVGVHARRTDYAFHLQVLLPSSASAQLNFNLILEVSLISSTHHTCK